MAPFAIEGKAAGAIGLMWGITFVVLLFVAARFYMNIKVVRHMYADDITYYISGFMMLLYTIFTTIAGGWGFGLPMLAIPVQSAMAAKMWEMIGQTFGLVGMSTAKCSLGLFLLRIVIKRWHKMAIWAASLSLLFVSSIAIILFWVQCLPAEANFDPRVPTPCIVDPTPVTVIMSIWCVVMDFFFATIPWVLVWNMNMRRKHKTVIVGSLSLGVFAGICGIIRTTEVENIEQVNYTEDTVALVIWSAAELAVTMICIGFAVLIPLYKHVYRKHCRHRRSNNNTNDNDDNNHNNNNSARTGRAPLPPQFRGDSMDQWNRRRHRRLRDEAARTQDEWEKEHLGLQPSRPSVYDSLPRCEAGGESAYSPLAELDLGAALTLDPSAAAAAAAPAQDGEEKRPDVVELTQLERARTADRLLGNRQ